MRLYVLVTLALLAGACGEHRPGSASRTLVSARSPAGAPEPQPSMGAATTAATAEARVECPPVESDPSVAERAALLRGVFTANLIGEEPSGVRVIGADRSAVLARARESRACPRRLDSPGWPSEDIVELDDPELGRLPMTIRVDEDLGGHVLSTGVADTLLERRRAERAVVSWLDAHRGGRVFWKSDGNTDLYVWAERDSSVLCVVHPDDDVPRPPPWCSRSSGPLTRVGLLSRFEPPYADGEPPGTQHRVVVFLDLDGTTYELRDGALLPTRVQLRGDDVWAYALEGPARRPAVAHTLDVADPASLPNASVRTFDPRYVGARCMQGLATFCCVLDDRWRCADGASAAQLMDPRSIVLHPSGELTFSQQTCGVAMRQDLPPIPSLMSHSRALRREECRTTVNVFHAAGGALVHDGSILVGGYSDASDRDSRGGSSGSRSTVEWDHTLRSPRCIELRSAALTSTDRSGTAQETHPPTVYGVRLDRLPRFATFSSPPLGDPGGSVPDLRGTFELASDGWRRVERCGAGRPAAR